MPVLDCQRLIQDRVGALRQAHNDAGISRAELDLSGGIDSAVMACLLVQALGPENVTLVHSRFKTNPQQSSRAEALALALECPLVNANLNETFEVLMTEMLESLGRAGYNLTDLDARCKADPTILGSIRSTLRAPIGRGFNRLTGGGLRHGTGNEDEDRWLRFYQKGGDGEVDSNPIAMLSKGEVYQLAWGLAQALPKARFVLYETIQATPSPDLWGTGDAHSDEAEMLKWTGAPFTYSRIDLETGSYSYVGTIERMNRFLDYVPRAQEEGGKIPTIGEWLFLSNQDYVRANLRSLIPEASASGLFPNFKAQELETLITAAFLAERVTRHKLNPNIPTYGSRPQLIFSGILTNDLPQTF